MDRRAFLGALGLLATPGTGLSQPMSGVPRLGLLTPTSATAPAVNAFRQGLREVGWVEGQNIVIEHRFAEGRLDRLPDLATELVRLKVDVIAAGATLSAVAAKNATGVIPIVMLGVFQPVELGLVASLARPGGNVTGLSWSVDAEIVGKGLQLLKETLPRLRLVAILWNPANPAHGLVMGDVKTAARTLDVQVEFMRARSATELDDASSAMAKRQVQAVFVLADPLFIAQQARLANLTTQHRLPSMHGLRSNVEAGGLMSYGPDILAVWRRAASFVDRILKGAKPADLPVERPTKFEVVINLKTAKTLGLTIPPSLLQRADQVIE